MSFITSAVLLTLGIILTIFGIKLNKQSDITAAFPLILGIMYIIIGIATLYLKFIK